MTNRSGGTVVCPAHIAAAMAHTARGTSLDGELVALDPQGRPALYAGAAATLQVLMVFDLIASPLLADTATTWQDVRLATLGRIVTAIDATDAIRMVPTATGPVAKQRLLQAIRARSGEGCIFRRASAPYQHGRTSDCMRWRDRQRELDVVVTGYQAGNGKLTGTVGAVDVALYDTSGILCGIGQVGSGWTDADRAELQRRREAGITGFVVTITCMGLSAAEQLIRPSAVAIRPDGDKRAEECTLASEVERTYQAVA
jgi:ATP-dependent DNA ligase